MLHRRLLGTGISLNPGNLNHYLGPPPPLTVLCHTQPENIHKNPYLYFFQSKTKNQDLRPSVLRESTKFYLHGFPQRVSGCNWLIGENCLLELSLS